MEEVTKCRYIDCVDTREKEQILHELPVCDTGLCVKWLINSGHVDLIATDLDALRSMKFFICNNHFTDDCYLSKGTLKENAVPSPHWSAVSRKLRNSKIRRKFQLNGEESSMEEAATRRPKEKNAPSEFEVDQWCRTCATKKQNLVSMTTKGKDSDMSLLSKLKLLIEIDDEDVLPTKMCDECVDKLEQSFKFFQQIYVADNTLRHVFPSARASAAPRKPLYSIGEHMRNEQKEKEREKEKEKEKEEKQKEKEEQQQQVQDRAPKVTRGIFRRGRGRPRTRGYAARARAKQRSAQIAIRVESPALNDSATHESRTTETAASENEPRNVEYHEERPGDTVFSLLTDTCHCDEELDWSDVLKVMNDQRYRPIAKQQIASKLTKNSEKKVEPEQEPEPESAATAAVAVAEARTSRAEPIARDAVPAEPMETSETFETSTEARKVETETEADAEGTTEVKAQADASNFSAEKQVHRLSCEFCNESFELRGQLESHLSSDHPRSSECGGADHLTSYKSESVLQKHRRSPRCGDRRYRCGHCEEEFLEKRTLREHVKKCELRDGARYCCDSCGASCASKQHLIDHMKTHGESVAESFRVPPNHEDSKKAESELVSSTRASPELEGNVECQPCSHPEKKVDSSGPLQLDGAQQGETTGGRQQESESASAVTCPDCNEQIQDTVELTIHRMRRHSMNRKDNTCLLCDNKSFPSLEEYEQHVLDHCKRLRISP